MSKKVSPQPIVLLNSFMVKRSHEAGAKAHWQDYFLPIPELSQGLPLPFLGIMALIWQLRDKDLQYKFPLHTQESKLDFVAWCVTNGRLEYRSLLEAKALWDAARTPADWEFAIDDADDPAHAISCLMTMVSRCRKDLALDLTTKSDRARLLVWFLFHGHIEHKFEDIPFSDWQIEYLLAPSRKPGLSRLQSIVYEARPDVQDAFPLPQSQQDYLAWYDELLATRKDIKSFLYPESKVEPDIANKQEFSFGVNVIGYAFGQLGIGEDARMATKALITAEIPVVMVNFAPGVDVPQADVTMASHVENRAKYRVNMFCLTALEHGRYFAEQGVASLSGRYNIGYWPWELAQWPDEWRHLLSLADEIWVSSKHTYDSLAPICMVPLKIMPMAVTLDTVSALTRADFLLPQNSFLFLFAFDLNSSAKRKNPRACIDAFNAAFPRGNGDAVGLVIKVHPPKKPNHEWDELKALQKADSRIHIIEQTLSKDDLLALYQSCDSFVSLHRAEGFGRVIAEVMLLERPVVTTAYSGNLDFNYPDNALLVRYRPIFLATGDYPYGEGQIWAEPDIEHAAMQMQRLVNNVEENEMIAQRGSNTIQQQHGLTVVGRRYAERLRQRLL